MLARLQAEGEVKVTHQDFASLLPLCTAVAIGDVYARRGRLAIAALQAGRHIIADKPICTELSEWEEIRQLADKNRLSVGCQLDLVEVPAVRQLRAILAAGEIGRVCTITIAAQHPLRLGVRAPWYFEPGAHGGTINDIGIHVFHLASWLTGSPWKKLLSAREWNAKAEAFPHFKDCAQFHGLLEDGTACFADVSYLAPDKLGYELPQYWRLTVHGTRGVAEASYGNLEVFVAADNDAAARKSAGASPAAGLHLDDFLKEIEGTPSSDGLTTPRVLEASRWALEAQRTAELCP